MRLIIVLALLLAGCITVWADDGIPVPWEEFKSLYRQSIEQEFLQKAAALPKVPQIFSIDAAQYMLTISEIGAQGTVTLAGRVLSGGPEPIPLFGNEVAISEVQELAGGTFIIKPESDRLDFLPEANATEFRVSVTFLLTPHEENGAHVVCFAIPPAALNSLQLTLPPEARLAEPPGIAAANNVYHFSARSILRVKYFEKDQVFTAPPALIEIDAITRLRIEKNRLMITACFQPMRPVLESLVLHAPQGAIYLASSLNASRLNKTAEDLYTITLPANEQTPFSVDFAIEGWVDKGEVAFLLPFIEKNSGTEDRFIVEEPDEGQVSVTAESLISSIPIEKLGEVLSKNVSKNLFYMKAPPKTSIQLAYKPFQTVSTPTAVLNAQGLFVSFSENGAVLSVLQLDVPPEVGARLMLKAINDAEVWSLTVNNVKQSVYTDDQKRWIVPLDGTQPSHVELAFLRHSPKLALQGVLDAIMPETGLPSRELCIGIALPPRVDLLSLEGPVSPASGEQWKPAAEFTGRPHFFSRSFYKGEGMTLSIAYKEPVKAAQ
ncbi:MAG TPA: hypothetical protein PLI09_22305 [Candidatus Hydrogenedentes bacterium]|nr:hypothetical protein [Candidatus Hydrogenedentota bacterium]